MQALYTLCVVCNFINICAYRTEFADNINHDVELLTESKVSWTLASKSCMLAGMQLTGEVNIQTVRFNVTNADVISSEAWIGAYVKYTPWFEFDGCVQGIPSPNKTGSNIASSQEPVKDCFNRCRGDFVLSEDTCICGTELELKSSKNAGGCLAKYCRGNAQSFCGDNRPELKGNLCMCLYLAKTKKQNITDGIGNCIVTKENENINEDCSEHHNYYCKRGDRPTFDNSMKPLPWSDAVRECYKHNKQFVSLKVSSTLAWSRFFRKYTYMWGYPSGEDVNYHCLSAYLGQDGIQTLKVRRCDEQLPVLCHLSEEPISSVYENISLVPRTDDLFNNEEFSYYYIIPVTVGSILFVIIVTAVCIRRKRKKNNAPQSDKLAKPATFHENIAPRERSFDEEQQHQDLVSANGFHEDDAYSELRANKTSEKTVSDIYDHGNNWRQKNNGDSNIYGYDHFQTQKPDHSHLFDYDTMANIRATEENAYGIKPEISTDASVYDKIASVQQDI